jgi:hypothetical protein
MAGAPLAPTSQVSHAPHTPTSARLDAATAAAAAAEAAASSGGVSLPSSSSLRRHPRLGRLHVGLRARAMQDICLLPVSRLLVLPVNDVLQETDEVINARTVPRLRGAFGWMSDDELALLARTYLDPERVFWARTDLAVEQQQQQQQQSHKQQQVLQHVGTENSSRGGGVWQGQ